MSDRILSISDITRSVQHSLEDRYGAVAVQGEISNFLQHSSGHRYFTLKDSGAQLKAVMWRSTPLRFTPTNGMSVVARGKITLYPPSGAMQIECRSLEALGEGDLQLAFEALKRDLYARGWFDSLLKKPLPRFPTTIGVVTSATGAAVRDICSTLQRRMPLARIILRPTLVQGEGAAEDIAAAIQELHQTNAEVLIVGRGGGSIEDLWAFNTEIVADAIFHARLPIISAVGHEIDFTIADFVADVRAATPTAAAELASRDQTEILSALYGTREYLNRSLEQHVMLLKEQLRSLSEQSALKRFPSEILRKQQELDDYTTRLHKATERTVAQFKQHLEARVRHFSSLHPLQPLERGFALLRREKPEGQPDGRIVAASEELQHGERITIQRKKQTVQASIAAVSV
ncbi:MAG: exodeoxyribonuclease VII large subunit [Candidatus Kapaibacterium sp.]|nr:MAG: exodeoxyribonuclease VII large subunit [Candidatus Kapabacteria bacterium]